MQRSYANRSSMNFDYNKSFQISELPLPELKIFTYPAPVLKKIAEPISEFNQELKDLAEQMIQTMYKSYGIGLAAPQIGKSIRLFVSDIDFDLDKDEDDLITNANPKVYINPKIIEHSGKMIYEEGCLSFPGIYEKVNRHEEITLEYQDIDGETHTVTATGIESVCLQHELDHLDGIVFIEKLSPLKQSYLKKKFLKSKKK